jgi:hypothetical protein
MSIRVAIQDIKTTIRIVELPDRCPGCQAEIKEGASLLRVQSTFETQTCTLGPVTEDLKADPCLWSDSEIESYPETQIVRGYECECGATLVEGIEENTPA